MLKRKCLSLLITGLFLFTAVLFIPISAGTVSGSGVDVNQPSAFTTTRIISKSTYLFENLTVGNLTIEPGVDLYTDGYSILCKGNFTNYGSVVAGTSSFRNYNLSYGGSGGGSLNTGIGNFNFSGTSGYSTRVPGGNVSGLISVPAGDGKTPSKPRLTESMISNWYSGGIEQYLSGAPGQNLSQALGGEIIGGSGSFGIFIQANVILNEGILMANGEQGTLFNSFDYSGSGGGGVIMLVYGSSIVSGVTQVSGGEISQIQGTVISGGHGGDGQVLTFQYGTSPPVKVGQPPVISVPLWAFSGSYFNYSFAETINGNLSTGYLEENVISVNTENQTFVFREVSQITSPIRGTITPSSSVITRTDSYSCPSAFTGISQQELNDIKSNKTGVVSTADILWNVTAKNVTVKVKTGTFNTIELSPLVPSSSGNGSPTGLQTTAYQNLSMFIDMKTGIMVKFSIVGNPKYNTGNDTIALQSSNIVPSDNYTLFAYLLIPVIAAIFAVIVVSRIYSPPREVKTDLDESTTVPKMREQSAEAILGELKIMLDKGLISQEFYDDSAKRLMPPDEEQTESN